MAELSSQNAENKDSFLPFVISMY